MAVPFDFVIPGPPVSQQGRARAKARWRQDVESTARSQWTGGPPDGGPVSVKITYFFVSDAPDVDNIPKPILDALNGLVFVDDRQVTDLLSRKRDLRRTLRIPNPPPPLLSYLGNMMPILHISITRAQDREVTSW